MNWLKRWALRMALVILGEGNRPLNFQELEHKHVKVGDVKKWLYSSLENDGWKQYYSWRNYALLEAAGHAVGDDHLIIMGRLLELRAFKFEIEEISKSYKMESLKEKQKEKKEKERVKIR